jgi:hypothetical protein
LFAAPFHVFAVLPCFSPHESIIIVFFCRTEAAAIAPAPPSAVGKGNLVLMGGGERRGRLLADTAATLQIRKSISKK